MMLGCTLAAEHIQSDLLFQIYWSLTGAYLFNCAMFLLKNPSFTNYTVNVYKYASFTGNGN